MSAITSIHARQILDSRANPTIEATIVLNDGTLGTAAVPSGASTGTHEALELRDNDQSRYLGKGVLTAVGNVNTIISRLLKGKDPSKQKEIDAIMLEADNTQNKANLGANTILCVSLACARAAAISKKNH